MKLSKVVGGLAALLPSLSAYGQLLIDAGGPRDVFFFSGPTAAGLDGLHIKVDTSRKGLDFDYLGYPTTALSLENVLLGGAVKATAVDGLEQFFRFERLPKIELLLLANKTWRRLIDPDHAWIWSLTSRINGSYADYALFDTSRPVGSQYFKRGFIGGEIIETISLGLPWSPDGFAFSGGVRTTSN